MAPTQQQQQQQQTNNYYPQQQQQQPMPNNNNLAQQQQQIHQHQHHQHQQQQQQYQQQDPQYNVVKSGFNRLWGNNTMDLLQNRHVLPPGKVRPPVIHLNHPFQEAVNCNPE